MPSVDTQYRTLELFRAMLRDEGRLATQFFDATRRSMAARWQRLTALFATKSAYALESVPLSAYAWVRCPSPSGCAAAFFAQGLLGMPGLSFGEEGYFRINLTLFDSDFEILLEKLQVVLAK